MKKKVGSIFSLALLTVIIFAGCDSSKTNVTSSSKEATTVSKSEESEVSEDSEVTVVPTKAATAPEDIKDKINIEARPTLDGEKSF